MFGAPVLRFSLLALPLLMASCAPARSPAQLSASPSAPGPAASAATPQVASDCRARADAVYDRQNRGDLSRRDNRDSPFSSSYNSGITTRGLGARFERDKMVADCVAANSSTRSSAASTGPTFSGQVPY